MAGEEDLKHEDKESDSEGGSPASQDHQNHQNQFTEEEVENGEKQLDVSHDQSIDENKSNGVKDEGKEVEIVGNEDGGVVQVERELKIEGEFDGQKINVEYVEPMIESNREGLRRSSSSSSSSSSGSSVEKYAVGDKNNIVVDNAPAVELVKESDCLHDTQVTDSIEGTTSASDLDKAAISEDVVQVTTSASDADNVTGSTVEPVVKEKGAEKLYVVDEKDTALDTVMENLDVVVDKATVSEVLVETRLEKRDEAASAASCEASAISTGNAVANTDIKASVNIENEDKVEPPHNAPTIDVGVCADNVKESPANEFHDHQLKVALPSRPVQTTSWKGCCGLFELFAGSNR